MGRQPDPYNLLTDSARPILQQTAGDLSAFAFLIATTTSFHVRLFYIDARDLNSGLHAYKINPYHLSHSSVHIVIFFLKET